MADKNSIVDNLWMLDLLKPKINQLEKDIVMIQNKMEQLKSEYIMKMQQIAECNQIVNTYQLSKEIKSKTEHEDAYSKDWKWPTKTMFVLKIIKRPITANEILKTIEIYEGKKVAEDKRTAVFAALTNLTKERKILRDKPGGEYVYSIIEGTDNNTDSDLIEIDLAK